MFEELKELICEYVDVDPAGIKEESRFIEDLGFNSYDFMSKMCIRDSRHCRCIGKAELWQERKHLANYSSRIHSCLQRQWKMRRSAGGSWNAYLGYPSKR